jgi:nitrite reductase (NADH) large subunit
MTTTAALVHVVVVGAGMVAHRFAESLLSRAGSNWRLTVIGEEERHPYDPNVTEPSVAAPARPDVP